MYKTRAFKVEPFQTLPFNLAKTKEHDVKAKYLFVFRDKKYWTKSAMFLGKFIKVKTKFEILNSKFEVASLNNYY